MVFIQDYNQYKLFRLAKDDFSLAKAFLDKERNKLERIEFFYPYKDDELIDVLEKGYFLALFDADKIIATFAFDNDENYAKEIAKTVSDCTGNNNVDIAYEMSGFVVAQDYRGQGIGEFMMHKIIEYAQTVDGYSCGIVQIENIASMSSFLKNGYNLRAVSYMPDGNKCGYFVRKNKGSQIAWANNAVSVEFNDFQKHKEYLAKGFVGVKIINNCILYCKIISE